jgi:hypothetical protein
MYANKTTNGIYLIDEESDTIHILTHDGVNVKVHVFSDQIIIERLDGPKTDNIVIR